MTLTAQRGLAMWRMQPWGGGGLKMKGEWRHFGNENAFLGDKCPQFNSQMNLCVLHYGKVGTKHRDGLGRWGG